MRNIRRTALAALMLLATAPIAGESKPAIAFDHVWIVVSPNAPERKALEQAGFHTSPNLNRHDGQGTASITFEFENAYLELIWPDPSVSVDPGREAVVEKFRNRMQWRTSGWCPVGVGFRRTEAADPAFPFPTWSTASSWMPKGSAIEILTPRDDTQSPSLFLTPRSLGVNEEANRRLIRSNSPDAAVYNHPLGVHRITRLGLDSPPHYQPIAAFTYLQKQGLLRSGPGKEWTLEVTFDGGKQGKTKDMRPDLPLVVHY
jgi:hypothetical protein